MKTFWVEVEHRSPEPIERGLYGVMVRGSCPRRAVDVNTRLTMYDYDDNGQPMRGDVEKKEVRGDQTVTRLLPNQHTFQRFLKVYTFDKVGKGSSAVASQRFVRFVDLPKIVAEAMVRDYGEYLDIREVTVREPSAFANGEPVKAAKRLDRPRQMASPLGKGGDVYADKPEVLPEFNEKARRHITQDVELVTQPDDGSAEEIARLKAELEERDAALATKDAEINELLEASSGVGEENSGEGEQPPMDPNADVPE